MIYLLYVVYTRVSAVRVQFYTFSIIISVRLAFDEILIVYGVIIVECLRLIDSYCLNIVDIVVAISITVCQ